MSPAPKTQPASTRTPPKKPVWDAKRPASVGVSKPLSAAAKSSAKAAAAKAGRPYPNLVDNMRAAARGSK